MQVSEAYTPVRVTPRPQLCARKFYFSRRVYETQRAQKRAVGICTSSSNYRHMRERHCRGDEDGASVTDKAHYLSGKQSKETIAARQKWFGIDNVNPRTGAVRTDRVIMSWAGMSTFAASFNGHVVMLDGYLAYAQNGTWGSSKRLHQHQSRGVRGAQPGDVPLRSRTRRPHGPTPQILAVLPTLQMYGMEEHCNDIKAQAWRRRRVNCTSILHAGAQFGAEATIPANLIPGVEAPGGEASALGRSA